MLRRTADVIPLHLAALVGALALTAAACYGAPADDGDETVTVGVGSTVEQQLLAALTVVALEEADIGAELAVDLGDTVGLRREALRGTVDVYWDYTGAAWALGLRQHTPPVDPGESIERVREADRDNGLVWLAASEANATLTFFVREEAVEDEPRTMDWLAAELSSEERTLCVDPDFRDRPGGLVDLAEVYPMDLDRVEVVGADETEAIEQVAEGSCFAGLGTATSGQARSEGLVPVADELGVFPAFMVAAVATEEALVRTPEVAEALEPVVELLDTATLARLNAAAREADSAEERQELARRELAGHLGVDDDG